MSRPGDRARIEQLVEKWRRWHFHCAAASREANHAGNVELDAYRDGKAMAYGDCIHDLADLLASQGERRPHEQEEKEKDLDTRGGRFPGVGLGDLPRRNEGLSARLEHRVLCSGGIDEAFVAGWNAHLSQQTEGGDSVDLNDALAAYARRLDAALSKAVIRRTAKKDDGTGMSADEKGWIG